MLTEALMALAAAGGTTLVSEMTKDGWTASKQGFLRLITRHAPGEAVALERELDDGHEELETVQGSDLERVRATQAEIWKNRIALLVEAAPELEPDLRNWIQQGPIAPAGNLTQQVVAKDEAQQAVLGSGVQHVNFHKGPR